MPILQLTYEDIAALVNMVPPRYIWEPDNSYGFHSAPVGERAGGSELRLKLMAAYGAIGLNPAKPVEVELTPADLWLLDTVLWNGDYFKVKMLNGTPLVRLAAKIWAALVEHHGGMLAQNLRPEGYVAPVLTPEQQDYLATLDSKFGFTAEEYYDDDEDL